MLVNVLWVVNFCFLFVADVAESGENEMCCCKTFKRMEVLKPYSLLVSYFKREKVKNPFRTTE